MSAHHGHHHAPTSGKLLIVSLVVTLLFVAVEAAAGALSGSLSLLSDAGHNLSDALALGLAAYAVWVARKPATAKHTYGYHRVSILAALFNAATLVVIALLIAIDGIGRFLHPHAVEGGLMIGVAAIAVVMNTVIAAALSGSAKESLNNRAAFIHMAGDALSSLAVVIAGVVIHYTGWLYADPLASLLIAAFILYSAIGVVGEATEILMESTPRHLDVNELIDAMKNVGEVCDVHDLHIWRVSDSQTFLSCHVALPAETSLHGCADILRLLNEKLHHDFGIEHATIQTEIDGLCDHSPAGRLYCEMEAHSHDSHGDHGHDHDHDHDHDHASEVQVSWREG